MNHLHFIDVIELNYLLSMDLKILSNKLAFVCNHTQRKFAIINLWWFCVFSRLWS